MKRLLPRKGTPGGGSSTSNDASSDRTLSRNSTLNDADNPARKAAITKLSTSPIPSDPEEFVKAAITPIFTYHPRHDPTTFEDVLEYHIPRYFGPDYIQRTNCVEMSLNNWLARIGELRKTLQKSRLRYIKTHIDRAERQSMQEACIAMTWEACFIIPEKGEEELVVQNIGILNLKQGKVGRSAKSVEEQEKN